MEKKFYSLPLNTELLMSNKRHETCNLNQSIAHHIHLINTSAFGEYKYDETFGCSIWQIEFDNLKSNSHLQRQIKDSLQSSLLTHEHRLSNIKVEVSIKQEEINTVHNVARIKKRIDIRIKATVLKTNESFSYFEYFYIGPLSY